MEDVTQDEVNIAFNEIKETYEKMILDSGKSRAVFIATDKNIASFLGEYQALKEAVEDVGLVMPTLDENLTITIS